MPKKPKYSLQESTGNAFEDVKLSRYYEALANASKRKVKKSVKKVFKKYKTTLEKLK